VAPARVWLFDDAGVASVHGNNPDWTPVAPGSPGLVLTPDGARWFEPVPDEPGLWIEGEPVQGGTSPTVRSSAELLGQLLRLEREMARLSQELATSSTPSAKSSATPSASRNRRRSSCAR
jgi:hypothetical protein